MRHTGVWLNVLGAAEMPRGWDRSMRSLRKRSTAAVLCCALLHCSAFEVACSIGPQP
jgi:hypothetical protein